MRRSRRKPRVTWLPVLGDNQSFEDELGIGTAAMGSAGNMLVVGNGAIQWDAFPVTFDYSSSAAAQQGFGSEDKTLADLVGGMAYRLRRIVGKLWLALSPINSGGNPLAQVPGLDVAAGFIVCKTDSTGGFTTDFDSTNPLAQDSSEDPWIWRRRWLLGNYSTARTTDPIAQAWAQQPYTNTYNYGAGQADGPHIDQKTARVIGQEERLACVIAARAMSPTVGSGTENAVLAYNLDIRLLGSLRPMQGNRRNASR